MKKRRRFLRLLSLAAALALLGSALTGCGRAQAASASASGPNTLEKVLTGHKLVVGCILANEPYGSKDADGKPIGYDIDIANLLAQSLGGVDLEVLDVTAAERITALETGKVDVVIGNFTITLERAQKVTFTDPYDVGSAGILVKPDSAIAHAKDLDGKKVGVTKGSTNQTSCENLIASGVKIDMQIFDSADDMETALKSGQLDAIIGDSPYCAYKQMKYPNDYKYVGEPGEMLIDPFYNAFGVQKNDQEWLNYLNKFIFQINTNGQNEAAYVKWLGKPLNIPLNPSY